MFTNLAATASSWIRDDAPVLHVIDDWVSISDQERTHIQDTNDKLAHQARQQRETQRTIDQLMNELSELKTRVGQLEQDRFRMTVALQQLRQPTISDSKYKNLILQNEFLRFSLERATNQLIRRGITFPFMAYHPLTLTSSKKK